MITIFGIFFTRDLKFMKIYEIFKFVQEFSFPKLTIF